LELLTNEKEIFFVFNGENAENNETKGEKISSVSFS
jgi:hypothetical protein